MALTLQYLRDALARRCGAWAALADVDEAIATALASLGVTPDDPGALADSDLDTVEAAQVVQVLDVAEWRVLESALNNCDERSLREVGIDMTPKDARDALRMRVDRLYARVREAYGIGQGTLSVGVLSIDMAAKGDDVSPEGSGW